MSAEGAGSKIPVFQFSALPLADKTNADNAKTAPAKKAAAKPAAAASDAAKGRKRTAAAMTEEARPAKRPATRGGATRGRAASVPPASITAPIAVPTPAVAQAIAFTAAPATMIGGVMRPAGEEPWEEIAAKTGQSVSDVLLKKLAFKRGERDAKKLEAMAPLCKELRAVGWHLLSEAEKAAEGEAAARSAAAAAEAAVAKERNEWKAKERAISRQMKEIQDMMAEAEGKHSRLAGEVATSQAAVAERQAGLAAAQEALRIAQAESERLTAQLVEKDAKIRDAEEAARGAQNYSTMLQSYNTNLQADVNSEKARRCELERARDTLQAQCAELGGLVKSLEQMLAFEKEQSARLQEERERAGADIAIARAELAALRSDLAASQAEAVALREAAQAAEAGKKAPKTPAKTPAKTPSRARTATELADLVEAREARAVAEAMADSRAVQIKELKARVEQLESNLKTAEQRVFEGELLRRKLHNTVMELKGNIRVFCRVRPPTAAELAEAGDKALPAVDFPTSGELFGRGLKLTVPGHLTGQPPQTHEFAFDRVFAQSASQEGVFEEISELVQSALDGHKVCIFAYGQTGSGKTHTMLGSAEAPGMIPRAMTQIFNAAQALAPQGWSFRMHASMLEVYNEDYGDLLAPKGAKKEGKIKVTHDEAGNTTISDITLVDISSPEQVQSLLSTAMRKRAVSATALNDQSSRSHMVFRLAIEGENKVRGETVSGVLNLIDLAGSERVKQSGVTGTAMKEAQHINTSLTMLGNVILSLASKEKHVSYRDSKLTWLLQPCLGGSAKTLMFVNMAPSKEFAPESLSSLRFASRVNACEIGRAKRSIKSAKPGETPRSAAPAQTPR